jgi:hypothetical protein
MFRLPGAREKRTIRASAIEAWYSGRAKAP